MKLSREELKDISAGATAVEYGTLLTFILKIIAFIKALLSGGSSGGGGDGGSGGGGPSPPPPPPPPPTPTG